VGLGDELMAAGHAQRAFDANPELGPVAICDHKGVTRWHDLFVGNPAIAEPDKSQPFHRKPQTRWVKNAKFCRAYIQYPFTPDTGWTFSSTWKARDHRPRLYLRAAERSTGQQLRQQLGPFILIEPTPQRGNKNRWWPQDRWVAFAELAKAFGLPIVQLEHAASRPLPDSIKIPHANFREACGVMEQAELFVTTEGGLAHAAAALRPDRKTVVLWGGCVSAEVLGYPEHLNIYDSGPGSPCGKWAPCAHCTAIWDRLTSEMVFEAVRTVRER
jgi:ADP-heptose:LPS heptosyltransferase